jgi:CRISPR/Cas system-associated endonuclease Cas1
MAWHLAADPSGLNQEQKAIKPIVPQFTILVPAHAQDKVNQDKICRKIRPHWNYPVSINAISLPTSSVVNQAQIIYCLYYGISILFLQQHRFYIADPRCFMNMYV